MSAHRVVIVGGGFGGLHAARALARAPLEVVLLDRRNFHLFQPLLYQVATGSLSPANIAAPLRSILARQRNVRVLLGEMTGIDLPAREVVLSDGRIPFDTLILATGSSHHYFGHPAWEALAPGLKTIEDATEIRHRVLLAFEAAERETDPAEVARWLSFVIVGGGPTGVELAGSIAEIAHRTLRREFRSIRPESASIVLVENSDRILGPYPPELSEAARRDLERQGVTVRTGWMVDEIRPDAVVVRQGGTREEIATRTVLWAAGVAASPVGRLVAEAGGCPVDRGGRFLVEPDCSLPGHPGIFAIGDLANWSHDGGKPLPGVAQVAMQQGRYVARLIEGRLRGAPLPPPFRYRDLGNMAAIGRSSAVAEIGRFRFQGHLAWLMWLFVHLMSLVQFQARVLVLIQWAWSYATRNQYARLITGESPLPLRSSEELAAAFPAAATPVMAPASPAAPASSPESASQAGS